MYKICFAPLIVCALIVSAALNVAAQNKNSSALQTARRDLMPVPADVEWKNGRLPVAKSFAAAIKNQTDERLKSYVARVMRRLEGRTVLEMARDSSNDAANAALLIETAAIAKQFPALGDDESYRLEINSRQAKITAPTTTGAMRGLETFLQLLEKDRDGFYFPAVVISDSPRFLWRGLMIDSARHFQPMEVLKRNLDAMAAVKLNVLHWHLTDNQGFRVESKKLPELHRLGSDGEFYTQEQVREIINYAAERGIRVMPEFDLPGHATAWLVSHPEIGGAPGETYQIERQPGIFDPTLDPTNEQTYRLLAIFFQEMAALFPDKYLHIGGDENAGKQWNANLKIQAFMRAENIKDNHGLQTYFNQRLLRFLQADNKIMMGWDEIFQPDLPQEVVIHSWRGQKALQEAARQGFQVVLSNGYYIDLMFSAAQHYQNDPLPADTTLTAAEQKRVLGGEATMWSEWVSPETIDSRIWSRTAAIAERLWSPREVNQTADMYRRLAVIDVQLEELGLQHRRNQAAMLRRLLGSQDIAALQTLVSVVEPVKEYKRYQVRPQTMLSPLTGLIDAARPDAEGARNFNQMVEALLANEKSAANKVEIEAVLNEWSAAGTKLGAIMQNSPALSEAQPLGEDLQKLAAIGLEAVAFIKTKTAASSDWRDRQSAELDRIAKPRAALEFAVVPSIRLLINAAAQQPKVSRAKINRLAARTATAAL